jgi:hypothetical protein
MKVKYETPIMELVRLELEDVICTSSKDNDGDWVVDDGSY